MSAHTISFQKVRGVENLYRYSNGTYYARFIRNGTEFRRSLKTKDKETAKRELATLLGLRTDERAVTLAQLVERYKDSIPNLAEHTTKTKKSICEKIQREWPGGSENVLIRKILPSQIQAFIARRHVAASQANAYLTEIRKAFELALADNLIAQSPVGKVKWQKRKTPKRLTPNEEQFTAIIADVRAQEFNADASDSGDFLEAMGLLGLGQAELWGIHRRDVDLERNRISVYRRKTSTPFQIPVYPQARALVGRLWQAP